MKICHITTVHPRYDIRIFNKMCVSLANKGHEVTLIVADGKGDELILGVNIRDVGDFTSSRIKRALNAPALVLKLAIPIAADCYHLHDPELLRLGVALKKQGKTVVYDSHEDVPNQILYKTWLGPLSLRKLIAKTYNRFEKKTVKKFDGLISVIEEITEKFDNQSKATIKNYPILSFIEEKRIPYAQRKNQIIYLGSLSEMRGVKNYIEAMQYIPDEYSLVLVGAFTSEEFEATCKNMELWNRVDFRGYQPMEKAISLVASSKVALSVLHPEKNYLKSIPTKGFEYLAGGVPTIISDFDYWKPFFQGCTEMITPKNPKLIAETILTVLENTDRREKLIQSGIERCKNYSWESEREKLIAFYEKITKKVN